LEARILTRAGDTTAWPDPTVQRRVERAVEQVLDKAASLKPREYANRLTHVVAALRIEADAIEELAKEVARQ